MTDSQSSGVIVGGDHGPTTPAAPTRRREPRCAPTQILDGAGGCSSTGTDARWPVADVAGVRLTVTVPRPRLTSRRAAGPLPRAVRGDRRPRSTGSRAPTRAQCCSSRASSTGPRSTTPRHVLFHSAGSAKRTRSSGAGSHERLVRCGVESGEPRPSIPTSPRAPPRRCARPPRRRCTRRIRTGNASIAVAELSPRAGRPCATRSRSETARRASQFPRPRALDVVLGLLPARAPLQRCDDWHLPAHLPRCPQCQSANATWTDRGVGTVASFTICYRRCSAFAMRCTTPSSSYSSTKDRSGQQPRRHRQRRHRSRAARRVTFVDLDDDLTPCSSAS
jgi:hypothetical protein